MISAVIPVRDGAAFVQEAIASVHAQTCAVECIVVDDGSRDASAEIAERAGARVLRLGGRGVSVARNAGAREAGGDLVAFLDADDRWLPRRLEVMHAALVEADAAWALCASRVVGEPSPVGEVLRLRPVPPSVGDLLAWTGTVVPLGSNLLMERELFDTVGGFDEELRVAEDWDLLLRLVAHSPPAYVDEPLVEYRWHADNVTRDVSGTEHALRRVYARHARRRRDYAGMHRMLAAAHHRLGDRRRFVAHALRSAALDPAAAARYLVRR